jgi:hypothetical protein
MGKKKLSNMVKMFFIDVTSGVVFGKINGYEKKAVKKI